MVAVGMDSYFHSGNDVSPEESVNILQQNILSVSKSHTLNIIQLLTSMR